MQKVGWVKWVEQLEVPPDSSQLLDFCRTPGQEQRAQELPLTVSRVVRSGVEVHSGVWMPYKVQVLCEFFLLWQFLGDHTTKIHVILPDLGEV